MKRKRKEILSCVFNIILTSILVVVSYPIFNSDNLAYAKEVAKSYDGYVAKTENTFETDLNFVSRTDGNKYTLFVSNKSDNSYKYEMVIISSDDNIKLIVNDEDIALNIIGNNMYLIDRYEITSYQTKQTLIEIETETEFSFQIKEID